MDSTKSGEDTNAGAQILFKQDKDLKRCENRRPGSQAAYDGPIKLGRGLT